MKHTQKPKRTASLQQIAVNRANAARSTGPRTPEGKSNSSQNARRHGFTASAFAVVRLEDLDEVAHLRADLVSVYRPVNSQELFAIERMAIAQLTILRAARLESGLFTTCLNETLNAHDEPFLPMNAQLAGTGDLEVTRAQNRNYLLAEGFHRITRQSNSWTLFLRYQAQAERQYRRAVEEFDRLKALRHELPNEPDCMLEPQPTTTTYTPTESNPIPPPSTSSPALPRPIAVPPPTMEPNPVPLPSAPSPAVPRPIAAPPLAPRSAN